jgi:hypothetical protein
VSPGGRGSTGSDAENGVRAERKSHISKQWKALRKRMDALYDKLLGWIKKLTAEKFLLQRAGLQTSRAVSELKLQLSRSEAENAHLRALLNAYRRLDGGNIETDLCWCDAALRGETDTVARLERAERDAQRAAEESESDEWDEKMQQQAAAEQLAACRGRTVT